MQLSVAGYRTRCRRTLLHETLEHTERARAPRCSRWRVPRATAGSRSPRCRRRPRASPCRFLPRPSWRRPPSSPSASPAHGAAVAAAVSVADADSLAVSFSRADSGSISSAYFGPERARPSRGGVDLVGRDRGHQRRRRRRRVHTTGVGAPRSRQDRDHRLAGAELGEVLLEVVVVGLRIRRDRGLERLGVAGVNARSACCTRLPSCASTSPGTSSGSCVTKNTPTPFERMSRTVCATWATNSFGASSNKRCASSKKKHELRAGRRRRPRAASGTDRRAAT